MINPQKIGLKGIGLKLHWISNPNVRFAVETIEIFLIVFALSWFTKTYVLDFLPTKDQSMLPTLNSGNHLVVEKYFNRDIASLENGNIIAIANGNTTEVKRVIGFPGDIVEIKNGYTFINGKPIYEPYANTPSNFTYLPLTVPEGHVFVLNDDRTDPIDSRSYGPIQEENIIGRVIICYWPLSYFNVL